METSSSRDFSISPEVESLAVSHMTLDQPVPPLKRQASDRDWVEAAGTVEMLNVQHNMLGKLTTLSFLGYSDLFWTKSIVLFDHISDVEGSS